MKVEINIKFDVPYSTIERYKENNLSNGFVNMNQFLSNETPKVILGDMFLAVEIKCKLKDGESLKDVISECENISSGKNSKLFDILNIGHDLQLFMKENDTNPNSYSNGSISKDFYLDFEPINKTTIGKRYVLRSRITENTIQIEKQLLYLLSSYCVLGYAKDITFVPLAGCHMYHIDRKTDYSIQDFINHRTLQLKKSIYNI